MFHIPVCCFSLREKNITKNAVVFMLRIKLTNQYAVNETKRYLDRFHSVTIAC